MNKKNLVQSVVSFDEFDLCDNSIYTVSYCLVIFILCLFIIISAFCFYHRYLEPITFAQLCQTRFCYYVITVDLLLSSR